uniref:Uncharacterized protein n=1 Tax=Candidatus Methanophagaceae archaeon ANME-1 ERB6 TaxID=2759912 RepID=A0A7G9YVW1_9EURY|nr:hypothetical protein MDNCFBIC_00015 [Methanosarcinales archaeon ANME-1 ERB6]
MPSFYLRHGFTLIYADLFQKIFAFTTFPPSLSNPGMDGCQPRHERKRHAILSVLASPHTNAVAMLRAEFDDDPKNPQHIRPCAPSWTIPIPITYPATDFLHWNASDDGQGLKCQRLEQVARHYARLFHAAAVKDVADIEVDRKPAQSLAASSEFGAPSPHRAVGCQKRAQILRFLLLSLSSSPCRRVCLALHAERVARNLTVHRSALRHSTGRRPVQCVTTVTDSACFEKAHEDL